MGTKTCSKCSVELSLDHFQSNGNGGLRSDCKECHGKQVRPNNERRNEHFSKKYPTPHSKCVYALKDKEGDIVYVGESTETSKRIYEHFNDKHKSSLIKNGVDPKECGYEILWSGDNDMKRKLKEKAFMVEHNGQFNRQLKNANHE